MYPTTYLEDFRYEMLVYHMKARRQQKKSCQVSLKFIYSEQATTFWEISTLLMSYLEPVKSKVEISQNFVAFSDYMNFIRYWIQIE